MANSVETYIQCRLSHNKKTLKKYLIEILKALKTTAIHSLMKTLGRTWSELERIARENSCVRLTCHINALRICMYHTLAKVYVVVKSILDKGERRANDMAR